MQIITVIGTKHIELGNCNANELYKILVKIKPEVIFDEIPPTYYETFYGEIYKRMRMECIFKRTPLPYAALEVMCIRKYMTNHTVKIVPVDIDITSSQQNYQEDIESMRHIFNSNEEYIRLNQNNDACIAKEGFEYLNSSKFLEFLDKKKNLEITIINSRQLKTQYLDSLKLFHSEQIEKRETAMIKNIYSYSLDNAYKNAVFLVGAEHKLTINNKIKHFQEISNIDISWQFFG